MRLPLCVHKCACVHVCVCVCVCMCFPAFKPVYFHDSALALHSAISGHMNLVLFPSLQMLITWQFHEFVRSAATLALLCLSH